MYIQLCSVTCSICFSDHLNVFLLIIVSLLYVTVTDKSCVSILVVKLEFSGLVLNITAADEEVASISVCMSNMITEA